MFSPTKSGIVIAIDNQKSDFANTTKYGAVSSLTDALTILKTVS